MALLNITNASIRPILFSCLVLLSVVMLSGCAFVRVSRHKDIVYLPAAADNRHTEQQLNVFTPARHKHPLPVFVFIHGGNWTSGKKSLYSFLGSRMARKHVVTVIIDYPLSPDAAYNEMAMDAAESVKWVHDNIARYGGDPERIFVAGHSAGGHLAGLIGVENSYFDQLGMANPIKGIILIDAAGLDMYGYMKNVDYGPHNSYLSIFSDKPETWKKASPMYNLHPGMPPMLVYQGGKTYPSIADGTKKFVVAMQPYQPGLTAHVLKGKKHIAMITQFFNTGNRRYKEIKAFMKDPK